MLRAQDTFSIVAVDPRTKEVGSAGASCIGNSLRISDVIEGVGAIHTQAFYLEANQQTAHDRMVAGDSPQQIIDYVTTHDAENNSTIRQYGVVDLVGGGRSAGYSGVNTNDYKNHLTGPTYSIQGNILIGPVVLDSMQYIFTHTSGSLADRLMATLLAAKIPGADSRCLSQGRSALSAFIRVVRVGDRNNQYLFRDVDNVPPININPIDPIDSLKKIFDAWKDSLSTTADLFLSTMTIDKDTLFANTPDHATITVTVKNNSNVPLGSGFDVAISNTGSGVIGSASYAGGGRYLAQLSSSSVSGTDTFRVVISPPSAFPFQLLDEPVVQYIAQSARTWTGNLDSFWTNAGNWSPKGIPEPFDTVVIPQVSVEPVYDVATSIATVTTLRVLSNARLTIVAPNVRMTVSSRVELNGLLLLKGMSGGSCSDTVMISDSSPVALTGEGLIPLGTIRRSVRQGSVSPYRFESPQTFVQFDGSGIYPSHIDITTFPDSEAGSGGVWTIVPSIANTSAHTVTTSSVLHFSTWFFGTATPVPTPRVHRLYHISGEGNQFRATLSLRYDPGEVIPPTSESDLQLLHIGNGNDTLSYRTFPSDSIARARDHAGKLGKPVKRGKGMPNAINVLDEAIQQGVFPANPLGDSIGGLVVGVSRLRLMNGKYKPDPDSIKKYGWVRLGKWDARKNAGKGYQDVLKTLYKSPMLHDGSPRRFDFLKEQKTMPPTKHNNRILAEQVALKVNILASLTAKTPPGFGDLMYNDGTTNLLNGKSVKAIAALCDTFLTFGKIPSGMTPQTLQSVIQSINGAFNGPIDTDAFVAKLKLKPVRSVASVAFLHSSGNIPPTTYGPSYSIVDDVPREFMLRQNYPNPFNPTTTIEFLLPHPSFVSMKIYNVLGQEIAILLNHEPMDDGEQNVEFDASKLASGVYFYRLVVEAIPDEDGEASGKSFIDVKKMVLLR